jgi:hypothetical protein
MYNQFLLIFSIAFFVIAALFLLVGVLKGRKKIWTWGVMRLGAMVISAVAALFLSVLISGFAAGKLGGLLLNASFLGDIGVALRQLSSVVEMAGALLAMVAAPSLFLVIFFVLKAILYAIVKVAQTAPSSRNCKSSAFMIVEDKDTLVALSQMRDSGAALLSGAQAAIVVMGDETKTDLWVDNCAISSTFVQLAVTAMDLVSCWVHCNGRPRLKSEPDGEKAEDYVTELLGIKDGLRPYCVIAIGYPVEE